jgi:hypothetical protein
VVLEYHPQGLFERTGNIWSVEGWRGEIRDGEVVRTHEDALEEDGNRGDHSDQDRESDYVEDEDQEPEEEDEAVEDEDDEGELAEDQDVEDGYDEDEPA